MNYLTDALSIGVPYDLFWHLNPTKLKPFMDAYHRKQREIDAQMWYMGQYFMKALDATVLNIFRDKNTKRGEYFEKPLLEMAEFQKKEQKLSEEEIIKRTEALFLQLEVMSNNEKRQKRALEKKKGEVD